MPYDSHTSPSLVHLCNDRPTDSIHVVPYVDTLGSSQCHTRHLSTGGVPRNGHVLVLNLNPMPTYASTGSVNPNPIMVARQETPSLADSNWVHSPHLNCSNSSFSLQALTPTNPTAAYCVGNEILIPKALFFCKIRLTKPTHTFSILQHSPCPRLSSPVCLQLRPTPLPPIASNQPSTWPIMSPLLAILLLLSTPSKMLFSLLTRIPSTLLSLTHSTPLTLLTITRQRRALSPLLAIFSAFLRPRLLSKSLPSFRVILPLPTKNASNSRTRQLT